MLPCSHCTASTFHCILLGINASSRGVKSRRGESCLLPCSSCTAPLFVKSFLVSMLCLPHLLSAMLRLGNVSTQSCSAGKTSVQLCCLLHICCPMGLFTILRADLLLWRVNSTCVFALVSSAASSNCNLARICTSFCCMPGRQDAAIGCVGWQKLVKSFFFFLFLSVQLVPHGPWSCKT